MVLAGEGVETLVYADEPVLAGDASMPLSALDRSHGGRAVPFVFFYKASLDVDRLIEALRTTLSAYPAVCGRYRAQADSTLPPSRIDLSNAGVPVHVCHTESGAVSSAMEHLPLDSSPSSPASVKIFARSMHETLVPTKVQMDPDRGRPDAPLLSFKITRFAGGGTAIGMLFQHYVCDADAAILFMKHWSQAFRGLPLDPAPSRDRCSIDALRPVAMSPADVDGFKLQVLLAAQPPQAYLPAFVSVMPKINGDQVCIFPLPKNACKALKVAAMAALQDGGFVSTDDVVLAHVWQALCRMRCAQLDLSTDSDQASAVYRACNIRQRTEPALGGGFFGNGVTNVYTQLPVRELVTMTPGAVAKRLRETLQAQTSEAIAAVVQWQCQQYAAAGTAKVAPIFDAHALTFVASSWTSFDWQAADFGARPVGFDHGALMPIVTVFTARPEKDGVNIYVSGPRASLGIFVDVLGQSIAVHTSGLS